MVLELATEWQYCFVGKVMPVLLLLDGNLEPQSLYFSVYSMGFWFVCISVYWLVSVGCSIIRLTPTCGNYLHVFEDTLFFLLSFLKFVNLS